MNETLQQAVVTVIQKATSGVEAGVSFLGQQLPDVIRQLVLYNLVKDGVIGGFLILFLIVYVVAMIKLWLWVIKKEKAAGYSDSGNYIFGAGMGTVVTCFFAVPAFISVCNFVQDFLELWLAPKVWLIEYAATLIKH